MRLEALEVRLRVCENEAAAHQETFLVSPSHEMNSQSMLDMMRQGSYHPRVDHAQSWTSLFNAGIAAKAIPWILATFCRRRGVVETPGIPQFEVSPAALIMVTLASR
jgi:hypothetical protein